MRPTRNVLRPLADRIGDRAKAKGLGPTGRRSDGRDDTGAILILALVFLVSVSLAVLALLGWIGTSLTTTRVFSTERSNEYALTSAVDLAVQSIRYTPLLFDSNPALQSPPLSLNASPPTYCWGTGNSVTEPNANPSVDSVTENGTVINVYVWCSSAWNPASASTRTVTISACLISSASACAAAPLLQDIVTFDDYPANVFSSPVTTECSQVSCGQLVTQDSWNWNPTVPAVTGITSTPAGNSGPITGSTGSPASPTITITGTGFVSGSTVNFVQESNGTPTSSNVVGQGTVQSENCGASSCTITSTVPAVTTGSTYFVTVTTPEGTSAYGTASNDVFTYNNQTTAPTLDTGSPLPAISGSIPSGQTYVGGSIGGGTSITINGSGFWGGVNPPTVNFVNESTGVATPVTPPSNVTVINDTTMTAISPVVGSTGLYYVQVVTSGGSAGSASNTSDTFSYSTQVPVVIELSPATGLHTTTTTFTITGGNLLSGSTVALYPGCTVNGNNEFQTSGTPISATVNSVTTSTTLSATAPAVAGAGTYYVVVTNSAGASGCYPTSGDTFTYT